MSKKLTQVQIDARMMAKIKKISDQFFAKLENEQAKERAKRPASIWDTI